MSDDKWYRVNGNSSIIIDYKSRNDDDNAVTVKIFRQVVGVAIMFSVDTWRGISYYTESDPEILVEVLDNFQLQITNNKGSGLEVQCSISNRMIYEE